MKAITPVNLPAHMARPAQTRPKKREPNAPQPTAARLHTNATAQSGYTGQELAPYTGRPGSLDHLLLPSRVGNSLHYRSLSSIKTVRSTSI